MPLAQEEETKVYFIYKDNTKIQESSRVLNFWNINESVFLQSAKVLKKIVSIFRYLLKFLFGLYHP